MLAFGAAIQPLSALLRGPDQYRREPDQLGEAEPGQSLNSACQLDQRLDHLTRNGPGTTGPF